MNFKKPQNNRKKKNISFIIAMIWNIIVLTTIYFLWKSTEDIAWIIGGIFFVIVAIYIVIIAVFIFKIMKKVNNKNK